MTLFLCYKNFMKPLPHWNMDSDLCSQAALIHIWLQNKLPLTCFEVSYVFEVWTRQRKTWLQLQDSFSFLWFFFFFFFLYPRSFFFFFLICSGITLSRRRILGGLACSQTEFPRLKKRSGLYIFLKARPPESSCGCQAEGNPLLAPAYFLFHTLLSGHLPTL